MIYILGVTVFVFGAVVAYSYSVMSKLVVLAQRERRELEDKLLALTNSMALTQVSAMRDPEPGNVTYVDEAKEWELSGN